MDLSPEGIAAQARELVRDIGNAWSPTSAEAIAQAALGAVCDAARAEMRAQSDAERLHAQQIHTGCHAERDELGEQVRQLREALEKMLCGNIVIAGDSRKCCPSWERCAWIRGVLAATERSHG